MGDMGKLNFLKNKTRSISTKMALNNSQKLLAVALALVLVAGMTSPAYASLIGDAMHVTITIAGTPFCDEDIVVVDPGVELIDCHPVFPAIDLNGDSIWFESDEFPDGTPLPTITYEFTDMDWVDNPEGVIVDVKFFGPNTLPIAGLSFTDHSITLSHGAFSLDCGVEPTCKVEFHVNIQASHDQLVGGTSIPIDQSALLLAGASSVSMWMIPVVIAGIGIGVFVIKKRN
jgi:hypothetical protein